MAAVGSSAGPKGAVNARSGPNKPTAPKGMVAVGTGKGRWIFKPIANQPKPSDNKPKSGSGKPINWLDPLTQKQIKDQATKTITTAYAPDYQSLSQDTKTAKGLDAKRASDNKYYQSWLQTQMDTLQSHADAAHASLLGLEQGLQSQQNTLYAGQQSGLVDQANARSGNVSNNANSTPLTAQVGQSEIASNLGLNATETQAAQNIDIGNHQLGATRANDFASLNATRTGQVADFESAMTKLANERSTLRTKETGDIAKEIARLQGIEISKAQSNRSYAAALAKLQLDQANINSEISTRAAGVQLGKDRLKLDLTKAQLSQMNSDRSYQLDVSKYNSAVAKDIYERDHGLGPYKPGSGGGSKPLSTQSQNVIYGRIAAVRARVEQLIPVVGSAQAAWHALHSGQYTDSNNKVHYIGAVGDDGLLNAAYNTRSGAGGLTPGDIAYLKKLGLSNPGSRLPVIPNYGNNYPGRT